MINCGNCGAKNPDGDGYCITCGGELAPGPGGDLGSGSDSTRSDCAGLSAERTREEPEFDVDELEPGTVLGAGRYRIEALLGTGGMGAVYRATDLKLGETVALKVLHSHLLKGMAAIERLRSEVRVARHLQHPGLVQVYDLGTDAHCEFYTMEHVEGSTLREAMQGLGRAFSLREAKTVLLPLLEALAYAHDRGVVHRDVKPENVLLVGGDLAKPKLTDFGIAKALGTKAFPRNAVDLGTPYYMAPEQKRDAAEVDQRADLYSVGVMLYELLTGERPAGRFPSPGEIRSNIPAHIDKLVDRLLQFQPDLRPGSAREVRDALARPEAGTEGAPRETVKDAVVSASEVPVQPRRPEAPPRPLGASDVSPNHGIRFRWRYGFVLVGLMGVILVGLWLREDRQRRVAVQRETRPATEVAPPALPATKRPTVRANLELDVPPDMVRVPSGSFWLGCNEKVDGECYDNEKPGKTVNLDEFWIDRTEVTVRMYEKCVRAGACQDPGSGNYCNWGNSGRKEHPVNCVDWHQAKAYCQWSGKRLPTEQEWEKAARGRNGRKYPWGNERASCRYAVMDDGGDGCGRDSTWPVGSMPAGASRYGALDMAGNVWEWTDSWYDSAKSGRVVRGGSWFNLPWLVRASGRLKNAPDYRGKGGGFRCAR